MKQKVKVNYMVFNQLTKEKKLNQIAISEKLGVSRQFYNKLVQTESIEFTYIQKLAEILEVKPEVLTTFDKETKETYFDVLQKFEQLAVQKDEAMLEMTKTINKLVNQLSIVQEQLSKLPLIIKSHLGKRGNYKQFA